MLCIPLVIFALIILADDDDDDDGVSERSSSLIPSHNLCKQRKNRGQKCIYNFLLHFVQQMMLSFLPGTISILDDKSCFSNGPF